MTARRAAPSSTALPKPAANPAKAPSRAALLAALAETREQQAASSEILRVISQSPTDARPVFQRIVLAAVRVLKCDLAAALLRDGDTYLAAAGANAQGLLPDFVPASRIPIDPSANFISRAMVGKTTLHLPDWSLIDVPPHERAIQDLIGAKSSLYMPLLRDAECVGVLALVGTRPNSFGPREIAQAESFRDHALIAIENARLFNETRQALEQQKASADVLGAISKSASDAAPVFEAIIDACQRLFGGEEIGVYTVGQDDMVRVAAWRGARAEEVRHDVTPVGESVTGRIIRERRTHHIPDLVAEPGISSTVRERAERLGSASLLYAPMLSEDRGLGSILVVRSPPKPFSEREQALLQSFADQAAIAIQNTRLFNETQVALERQTATANVLKVISQSVSDAAPVFETILESCQRLFGLEAVAVYLVEGDTVRGVANRGWAVGDWGKDTMPLAGSSTGLAIAERRAIHIPDLAEKPGLPEKFVAPMREAGGMTVLYAPMLLEDRGVGSIVVSRRPAKPFSDKEIALVQSFADQAVIAIQNARMFEEVQARTRDLEESLAQQTATADVLKVISRSAFDLNLAASTILGAAARLCRAPLATLHLRDGGVCRLATQFGLPEAFEREASENPIPVRYPLHARRTARAGDVAHFTDAWTDPDYLYKASARLAGYRALVVIPLMREGELVGIFSLGRPEPEAFTESQIKLTQTFADQAAIAIENARLFNEVKARTDDLSEALRQQTATADVLKVISRSAFDLQTVLDTLTASATKLCDGDRAAIFQRRGDLYHFVSNYGFSDEMEAFARANPLPVGSSGGITRAGRDRKSVHIPDVLADPEYTQSGYQSRGDYRTLLSTPLMRAGEPIGGFVITRRAVRPFNDRQIELLQTFADQAVIAIENVRLFDEVQARTHDLTEALQQQTATAEVLKVISRSAFDLQAVLDTLTSSAVELSGASNGVIALREADGYRYCAFSASMTPEFVQYLVDHPPVPGPGSGAGLAIRSGRIEQIPDVLEDPDYQLPMPSLNRTRSILAVPLLRDDRIEGAFVVTGAEPGLFPQRQIDLVQTFADQAVIAIENVRLFEEVQARTRDLTEALQMQTATSDVLKVISRSAFDLDAVFKTLISSAVELAGATTGTICVRDGDVFRYRETIGAEHTGALARYLKDHPATPGRSTIAGRVLLSGKVERIPDCLADPEYVVPMGSLATNVRSLLGAPLLGKEGVDGAIILTRDEPGHFSDRQVEIVQTFADQAVIALENVRLFDQVQARTRELAASLDDLRKAQDRLIQSEKLASLGQLTAGIAHEIKNPLNFINNFSALSRELMDELRGLLEKAPLDAADREEASDLIGMIDANLDKVVSHGKRADSIVKNMLLHSREGSGERGSVNVNAMVEEALNLAYHGARAEKPGFNVTIAKALDPQAGTAGLYPQEMTRVLLNLISNAFYATTKRKQTESNAGFEPMITASTRDLGHSVEIAIRDNGTGIPDEVKAKMFNPFFTTKPAGDGTGLGLSLSHDIVVKQHGGTIEVTTEPGAFTQFTLVLPRAGAAP